MTASTQNLRFDLDQSTGALTVTFTPGRAQDPVSAPESDAVAAPAESVAATPVADAAGIADSGSTEAEAVSATIPPTI